MRNAWRPHQASPPSAMAKPFAMMKMMRVFKFEATAAPNFELRT
jgi:hypothetical protein